MYLAAVLDLHSRAVVGWSMGSHMRTSLVLDALAIAVWRRKPKDSVIIHLDQGSQGGFNRWCKENRLSPSVSCRGNCWDNAVAESFFSSLKSEQIKKRIDQTRVEGKSEIFDCIENIVPTQLERVMDDDEVIISKTDTKEKITYGNRRFPDYSGFKEQDFLGIQHNMALRPDMPRVVFKLLRGEI